MKRFTLGAFLATLASVAASLLALKGGFVNPEAEIFIPRYLKTIPVTQKIFSPEHTDWGLYQARELSYFFDWLDCRFIAFSCSLGIPHFLSLTHYAGCALIGLALGYFARAALNLPNGISLGLMGLWLTSPCVLMGGSFYRSAKILAAAALLFACMSSWLYLKARIRSQTGLIYLASNVLFLVVAALADRQGAFLGAAIALWLAMHAVAFRDSSCTQLSAAAFLSVAVGAVYAYWLGPLAIRHFDGHAPSLEYMHVPLREAMTDFQGLKNLFWYGPTAAVQEMGATLGGLPWLPLFVGICWLGWHLASGHQAASGAGPRRLLVAIWYLMPLLVFMAMYSLMAVRHGDVVRLPDFKIIYYPLPLAALTVLMLSLAVASLRRAGRVGISTMTVLVWVLVAGNVGNLPHNRLLYSTGTYAAEIHAAPATLAMLKTRSVPATASPAIRAIAEADGFLMSKRP
jgi:hypothetical protein